jgi:hypothetical protein
MGWITPISLLTPMMDTNAVSGRMVAFNSSMSIRPLGSTGRYVTSKPSDSSARQESNTH